MKNNNNVDVGLFTICGSLLLSLPLFPVSATAQQTRVVNPTNTVKRLCITNAPSVSTTTSSSTQSQGQTVSQSSSSTQPGAQRAANPTIRAAIPSINITLVNNSNATICYQAIKHTRPRQLLGKSQVTLEALSTPTTVTFYREDGGLLRVSESTTRNSMTLTLTETTNLGADRSALAVDDNGTYAIY